MFDEIKKVCNLVSKEAANLYAKETNQEAKKGVKNGPSINQLRKEIEALCVHHNVTPSFGPVQSGTEMPDGKVIDFIAFSQTFHKQAAILSGFIEELAGMFIIEEKGNSLSVKGVQNVNELNPCLGSYFVGSEFTYAVDLRSGKILKISGHQVAGGSRDQDGRIILDINIETELTLNDIIHEIVHLKVPDDLQRKVPHTLIDKIGNEVEKHLTLPFEKPLSSVDSLQAEYLKILTTFKKLDEAFVKSNLFS